MRPEIMLTLAFLAGMLTNTYAVENDLQVGSLPLKSRSNQSLPALSTHESSYLKLETALSKFLDINKSQGYSAAEKFAYTHNINLQGGRVLVELALRRGVLTDDIDFTELRKSNVEIADRSDHFITVWAPVDRLGLFAAELESVLLVHRPYKVISDVTSEGVRLIGAPAFHDEDYTGEGVTVAIIDLGFSGLSRGQRAGELPQDPTIRNFTDEAIEEGSVHGAACVEIVYDFVPDADFYLVKVFTDADLENAIDYVIEEEVDVVSMSLSFPMAFDDYFRGGDPICEKVNEAFEQGIMYINSGGNQGQRHYRARFDSNNDNDAHIFADDIYVNHFGPNADRFSTIREGSMIWVSLAWDDFPESGENFDLYLVRWDDNDEEWVNVAESTEEQNGDDLPTEWISYRAEEDGAYGIIVTNRDGEDRFDFTLFTSHDLAYKTVEGSLVIPALAEDNFAVAAIYHRDWDRDPPTLEAFSSRGPTYDNRIKPDISGVDGVTSFIYDREFFGTSASAPSVAGAAALALSSWDMSNVELRDWLIEHAEDVGDEGQDNEYGHGLCHIELDFAAPDIDLRWEEEYGFVADDDDNVNPDESVIDFRAMYGDELYAGYPYEFPITILNEGTEDLEITEIFIDEDDIFSVDQDEMVIAAEEEAVLTIIFEAEDVDVFEGNLTIRSNDPDEQEIVIQMLAESYDPPVIVIDPMQIEAFVVGNEVQEASFNVANDGGGELRFSTEIDYFSAPRGGEEIEWLSCEQDDEGVEIFISAYRAPRGMYSANLIFHSNDPENPQVPVNITMMVRDIPVISVFDPAVIELELNVGEAETFTLNIANSGDRLLYGESEFEILDEPGDEIRGGWIRGEVGEFEIEPDDNMDMEIQLDATDCIQGEYIAQIVFSSNDPENPEVTLSITMNVISAPDIDLASWGEDAGFVADENDNVDVEQSVMDFNALFQLFLGEPYEFPITVMNEGTEDLEIDEIRFEGDEVWTADQDEMVIAAEEEAVLTITFEAEEGGEYEGTLIIRSNDPDEEELAIRMIAECFAPPEVQVDPMEIESDGGGEYVITISNTGDALLRFYIEIEVVSEPERDQNVRSLRNTSNSSVRRDDFLDELGRYSWNRAAVNTYKNCAYDFDNELMWLSVYNTNHLKAILFDEDYEGFEDVIEEFRADGNPMDMGVYNGVVHVISWNSNSLLRFDAEGNWLEAIDVGRRRPCGVAFSREMEKIFIQTDDDRSYSIYVHEIQEDGQLGDQVGVISNFNPFGQNLQCRNIEWVDSHTDGQLWIHLNTGLGQFLIDTEEWEFVDSDDVQWGQGWGSNRDFGGVAYDGTNLWHGAYQWDHYKIIDDGIAEHRWITVEPTEGEVEPDEEMEIIVILNPAGLRAGDYEAELHILTNDPENPDVVVIVFMHVEGAPDIDLVWSEDAGFVADDDNNVDVEESVIDLTAAYDPDGIFRGAPYRFVLLILNEGNEDLAIGEITIEGDEVWTVDPAGDFVITVEDEEAILEIIFEADDPGEYEGTLVFHSNDPDEEELAIRMVAECTEPPVIVVELREIQDDLNGGDVETHQVNIANEGEGTLRWKSEVEYADEQNRDDYTHSLRNTKENNTPRRDPVYSFRGINVANQYSSCIGWDADNERMWVTNYTAQIAAAYTHDANYEEFEEVARIDIGPNMDGCWINGLLYIPVSYRNASVNRWDENGENIGAIQFDYDVCGLAADADEQLLFVMEYASCAIHVYELTEDNEAGDEIGVIRNHRPYHGNITVYGMEWIAVHEDAPLWMTSSHHNNVYQIAVDRDEWRCIDSDETVSFNAGGIGQPWCTVAHDGENLWASGYTANNIRIYDDGFREIRWITIDPSEGELDPNSNYDIDVILSAVGLIEGDYEADVHIFSNDPENPDIALNVRIHVTDVPDIDLVWSEEAGFVADENDNVDVEESVLDFNARFDPHLYNGGPYQFEITVLNEGNAELEIDDITVEGDEVWTVDPAGDFVITVEDEEAILEIIFEAEEPGEYEGTLIIHSNDPDEEELAIRMVAECTEPPVIVLDPQEIVENLNSGEIRRIRINVANQGEEVFRYTTEINQHGDWISVEPEEGEIPPHEVSEIIVILDARELDEGDYEADLIITSVDDEDQVFRLNILLHVRGIPDIEVVWNEENGYPDLIDFGYVSGDEPVELQILVHNVGGAALEVDEVSVTEDFFSVEPVEFVVDPDQNQELTLTFEAEDLGEYEDILTIVSNDPDEEELEIPVRAIVGDPPRIVVDPREIEVEMDDVIVAESINIANEGEGLLRWSTEIEILQEPDRDGFGRSLRGTNGAGAPRRDDPGDLIASIGGNAANQHSSCVGWDPDNRRMWVSNYTNQTAAAITHDANYEDFEEVLRINTGNCMDGTFVNGLLFLGTLGNANVNRWDENGNNIGAVRFGHNVYGMSADEEEQLLFVMESGNNQAIHVYEIDEDNRPGEHFGVINNHIGYHQGESYGLEWVSAHEDTPLWMVNEDGNRIYQIAVDRDEWTCVDSDDVVNFAVGDIGPSSAVAHDGDYIWASGYAADDIRIYDDGVDEIRWISVEPMEGELEADQNIDLDVILNATGCIEGHYEADIHFLSNDPENPDVVVNVFMHVRGEPEIEVVWDDENGYPNLIDFGENDDMWGPLRDIVIDVINIGTAALAIDDISSETEFFSVDPTEFVIDPRESQEVTLTFNEEEPGEYEDILTIVSNDPNNGELEIPIRARILGSRPPEIAHEIPDQEVEEDEGIFLVADLYEVFSDPEDDELYFYAETDNEHLAVIIDDENLLYLEAGENWNGEATVTVTANDDWAEERASGPVRGLRSINDRQECLSYPLLGSRLESRLSPMINGRQECPPHRDEPVELNFTVTVNAVNDPPRIVEAPDVIDAREGERIEFDIVVEDADVGNEWDNDRLSFTFRDDDGVIERGATITILDENTGRFVWQTDFDDAGVYIPIIRVGDNFRGRDLVAVRLNVENVNRAPEQVIDFAEVEFDEDAETRLIADLNEYFADPDEQRLLFVVEGDDMRAVVTEAGLLYARPLPDWNGETELFVTAHDGRGGSANGAIPVTVHSINDPSTAFSLLSPENNSLIGTYPTVEFSWQASEDVEDSTIFYSLLLEFTNGGSIELRNIRDTRTEVPRNWISYNPNQPRSLNWSVWASDGTDAVRSREQFYLTVQPLSLRNEDESLPTELTLGPVYPNPFNDATTIRYTLPKADDVLLTIHDPSGRLVDTLVKGYFPAGRHQAAWNGYNQVGVKVSSGLYICRLVAHERVLMQRIVLLR